MVKRLSIGVLNQLSKVAANARNLGWRGKSTLWRFGSWLLEIYVWSKFLLLSLAGIFLAAIVCWGGGGSEQSIRLAGTLLQLFGLITVVWGIDKTRRDFGLPGLRSVPGEWVRKFPPYRRKVILSAALGRLNLSGTGDLSGKLEVPEEASLEERFAALEKRMREELKKTQTQLNQFTRRQTQGLDQERSERAAEDTEIREKLTLSHTGGLHISLMGAMWLFVGVILAGAAPEIACWLTIQENC